MSEIVSKKIALNDNQIDEDILNCEITHEELEAAAGNSGGHPNYSSYQTISYPTWSSTCQCGC
jgi:hypothetical protein